MPDQGSLPVFDGHNDTLLSLILDEPEDPIGAFFNGRETGHIDWPRSEQGHFAGGFFAIFPPSKRQMRGRNQPDRVGAILEEFQGPIDRSEAVDLTMRMAAVLHQLEAHSDGRFCIVRDADTLDACLQEGKMAAIFHIEGAEVIDTDLDALHVLYAAGLRSVGLVWSRPNAFGFGVPFSFPGNPDIGPGLTAPGKALVKACNALGIMVDLSHLNAQGFWQVAELSDAPLVATHSGAHACCPSPRNLTDDQLDAIRDTGGVAGINYHVGFLREDGQVNTDTPLSEITRHAVYMVDRMGIDHVALGSDFDGATMPAPLHDATGLPRLIDALRQAGFDRPALQKIAFENWQRVLRKTWKPTAS